MKLRTTLKNLGTFLVGLALIVGGAYLLILVAGYFVQLLKEVNPEIAATIIATSGTVIVAVISVLVTQRKTKERQIQEAHRSIKVKVYDEFMRTIVEVLRKSKDSEGDPDAGVIPEDFEEFFYAFSRDLIVWGSPGVIQAWHKFRDFSDQETESSDPKRMMLVVDSIFREIRIDLGNKNSGLVRGDLVRLFINDWNKSFR